MNKAPSPAEPRFLWTGIMILIPVLALGSVGLWQLRQDRATALTEAQGNVENELGKAFEIGKEIPISSSEDHDAVFSTTGEVIWPKPIPIVPAPNTATNPHAEKLDKILRDPTLTLTEQARALHELATLENCGTTTAGLPVKQLALRNALRFGKEAKLESSTLGKWAYDLTIAATENPTIFSEQFLNEAKELNDAGNLELEKWNHAQASRKFLQQNWTTIQRLIDQQDQPILSKWLDSTPETFCQLRRDSEEIHLSLYSIEDLRQRADDRLEKISLPRHLAIRLSLDERLVHGDPDAEVLSMINDTQIRAEIIFTDRDSFFRPVRQRSIRTAWLIGLAVLAAGIGWFAAWRAFLRQKQLAAMKDNFVSAVSHELKAPIASIGLMAEELGAGSKKSADYTRLIAGECARLGSLVENVLDYARIESGHDGFNFEEADLGDLARAIAELMRPPAAERAIEIHVHAPPSGELHAVVDARALGRALINLLDNAIKYAPPKTAITLTAAEKKLTVADQGAPIPAAERRQIFERFYRSGSELTRETKGVGIGLSLVRHIAEGHGGKAWVESNQSGNHFNLSIANLTP